MINKHNQKLIITLENQKIYDGFMTVVNGFWKVKPEILAFQENRHKSLGFPI